MTEITYNTDIEDKVKEILITKLQNNQSINDLNESDIQTIKKLFELF